MDTILYAWEGPLPSPDSFDPAVRRAPKREAALGEADIKLAVKNALRGLRSEAQNLRVHGNY